MTKTKLKDATQLALMMGEIDHAWGCERIQQGLVNTDAMDCTCHIMVMATYIEYLHKAIQRLEES